MHAETDIIIITSKTLKIRVLLLIRFKH